MHGGFGDNRSALWIKPFFQACPSWVRFTGAAMMARMMRPYSAFFKFMSAHSRMTGCHGSEETDSSGMALCLPIWRETSLRGADSYPDQTSKS
jgi:hypothetical protein